jgi:Flp pilus assembly pilin Flp
MRLFKRLIGEEEGQDVVEYSLMIGLIVLGFWTAVTLLDIPGAITDVWTNVDAALEISSGGGFGGS